jgi:hypothetical protein
MWAGLQSSPHLESYFTPRRNLGPEKNQPEPDRSPKHFGARPAHWPGAIQLETITLLTSSLGTDPFAVDVPVEMTGFSGRS